jgi:Mg-chelatase subunit ChlD
MITAVIVLFLEIFTFSPSAGAWSQDDGKDPLAVKAPGTHRALTTAAVILACEYLTSQNLKENVVLLQKHKEDLIRGQWWADIFNQEWSAGIITDRRIIWAGTEVTKHPDSCVYHVYTGPGNILQVPLKHTLSRKPYYYSVEDSTVIPLKSPEWDWLNEVIEEHNKQWPWDAIEKADFWYKVALETYKRFGDSNFDDPFTADPSNPKRQEELRKQFGKANAFNYLGRAMHYVQDMTCPAHARDAAWHLDPSMWTFEAVYSHYFAQPSPNIAGLKPWTQGVTGGEFAQEAHRRIEPDLTYLYELTSRDRGLFTDTVLDALQYAVEHNIFDLTTALMRAGLFTTAEEEKWAWLSKHTTRYMDDAVELGAGMLIRFLEEAQAAVRPVSPVSTATILVMDVSGSMSWQWRGGVKIESAKKAALQYIEQVANEPRPARVTHYIGVVTFSDGASVACPLTASYDEAKKTVISLGTIASTNLGAGLDTALQELSKLPAGAKKFIILLSDGMTNTGKSREAIFQTSVTEARRQGICIHTVGFGDPGDIDEDFLKKIATQSSCGSYNYASSGFELFTTYVKVRHATLGSNRFVEYKTTTPAYFLPGESITLGAFQLTAPAQELHYTVAWSGPVVLQAKLVDPQGRVVDNRHPNSVIYSGSGFSHVTVFSPIPGIWRAAATVKSAAMQPAEYYGVASARTGGYVIPYIPPPCLIQVDNTCVIPMPDLPTVVVVAIGIAVWIWWLYNQFGGFLP